MVVGTAAYESGTSWLVQDGYMVVGTAAYDLVPALYIPLVHPL